jgi:cell wall-associated NlpC family hydrolase
MLLTFKRSLAVPLVAAVAVLPVVAAGETSAEAATSQPAAAAGRAATTARAAETARGTETARGAATARAAARHHRRTRRKRAYIWAAHQHGKPYCWGGTSGCFDCSGLVMAAYRHVGLHFGRDTAQMLASGRLVRVSRRRARKGDLAFYGSGHVELFASRRYTLGALHSGTRIGWHRVSPWWRPTMYFRVKGARRHT